MDKYQEALKIIINALDISYGIDVEEDGEYIGSIVKAGTNWNYVKTSEGEYIQDIIKELREE